MIVSRTPFRVSLFGGGTDYPTWYRRHGGAVLAATIDKYCYIACRYLPPFFDYKYRIVWSRIETCDNLDQIAHPVVREVLRHKGIDRGLEVHHQGDLPARSGVGSSSAFTVGFLHSLYALNGRMPGKRQLAEESIYIEQEILRETVGSQDQVLAAYGGLNHIRFMESGETRVVPVTISPDRAHELNSHLMLIYTGVTRTASNVATAYVTDLDSKSEQLRKMTQMVDEALEILNGARDICEIGVLLDEAWRAKRSLGGSISNSQVDDMYAAARSAGAVGGKLLGAGGGGFALFFAPPSVQPRIRELFKNLIWVPFKFENAGSQIIVYETEPDFSASEKDRNEREITGFRELVQFDDRSRPGQGDLRGQAGSV